MSKICRAVPVLVLLAAACSDAGPEPTGTLLTPAAEETAAPPHFVEPADADDGEPALLLASRDDVARAFATGPVALEGPIAQLSFWVEADERPNIEVRPWGSDAWLPAQVTWYEADVTVARVLLDAPVERMDIRGLEGARLVHVDAFPQLVVDPARPLTAQLPHEAATTPLRDPTDIMFDPGQSLGPDTWQTVHQGLELPSFLIGRAAWGARNPGTVCGSRHNPTYITVHHTVTGTPDSMSAPARMRAIQAFHIDGRGWCDIGYHFLVGHDAKIYQGRASHEHTGAHVGNANANNVGVSFMGTFMSSPGQNVPENMMNAGADIIGWLARRYAIPFERSRIRGHQEWAATACPGDTLFPRLQNLVDRARGGTTPVEPPPPVTEPTWSVDLDVRPLALTDRLREGSSAGVADVLPGATFEVQLLLTNGSDGPIRGVELGFALDSAHVRATSWRIETDWPARDRASWVLNSADSEPLNPPRNGLGSEGTMIMHAFAAGESKRLVLTLEATEPSLGRLAHPGVRGWLRSINDVYGPQTGYAAEPATNRIGRNVRARADVDVLTPQGWTFESTAAPAGAEGWVACDGGAAVPRDGSTIVVGTVTDCALSPAWTRVDATAFPHLRVRLEGPATTLRTSWGRAGEPALHEARFAHPGGDADLIVDLRETGAWTGDLTWLRIRTEGGEALRIHHLVFQDAAASRTSVSWLAPLAGAPVPLLGHGDSSDPAPLPEPTPVDPDPVPPAPEPEPGPSPEPPPTSDPGDGPGAGADPGTPGAPDDALSPRPSPRPPRPADRGQTQRVSSSGGCSASPATPSAPWAVIALAGALVLRRRRARTVAA